MSGNALQKYGYLVHGRVWHRHLTNAGARVRFVKPAATWQQAGLARPGQASRKISPPPSFPHHTKKKGRMRSSKWARTGGATCS